MVKLTYSIIIIYGSQMFLTLAEQPVKSEENRQELLLCRKCGSDVADSYYLFNQLSPGARKSERRTLFGKSNVTVQTLVNPFGVQFEIVTTEKARCHNIGNPQGADSWFPGYSWRICTCPHCGAHIGWTFENSSLGVTDQSTTANTFHGLILSNILGENFTDSLIMMPNIYKMQ
ncbi:protein cereblon-like isoform X2 [Cydia pomonella]|uniref:protein cereblon-like isoform X2 n=1 Tax=Cydia pomonella TaxID=82600 RepID=UPI002ADE2383|nr:protein cereblon-like isoform X2 [Cydia pomonella]